MPWLDVSSQNSCEETGRAERPGGEAMAGFWGGIGKLVTCLVSGFLKAQGLRRFCRVLFTCSQ